LKGEADKAAYLTPMADGALKGFQKGAAVGLRLEHAGVAPRR
jgi:hypothetical protein